MATQNFKRNFLILYREWEKTDTCSLFPPFGGLYPSYLLPSQNRLRKFKYMFSVIQKFRFYRHIGERINKLWNNTPNKLSLGDKCPVLRVRQSKILLNISQSETTPRFFPTVKQQVLTPRACSKVDSWDQPYSSHCRNRLQVHWCLHIPASHVCHL